MTFLELSEKILNEEKKALSVSEIWAIAIIRGYDKELNSVGKTPKDTLSAQLYVNSKDVLNSTFAQTDTRPKKFYLKAQEAIVDLTEKTIDSPIESIKAKKYSYLERDLHPFLTYYAYYHLHCYTKTINHTSSSKKSFGEWVHPDIVGFYTPFVDWKPEVYDLSVSTGNNSLRLLSFELKRELNFGNLRESFFQTVSNSSWANESYLVAADVSEDEDFLSELSRLSTSFGIGVIKLNLEDPHSSEILFPARFKDSLDWETINKLTMNPDFKEFISSVKIDVMSKRIHKKDYDLVEELDTLKSKIKL